MKQTSSQWAIIALFFLFSTSLSAQNHWTPMQKEWFSRIVNLLIAAKKTPVQAHVTGGACAISNEITITIAPCGDNLKKEASLTNKPVE
jgi:hypothetical protein